MKNKIMILYLKIVISRKKKQRFFCMYINYQISLYNYLLTVYAVLSLKQLWKNVNYCTSSLIKLICSLVCMFSAKNIDEEHENFF